ncbi:glycoside hydrolase family 18 protein [Sphingomonas naasensis]|uniref:chitinase n=1 Tax=Sphingomonas naasensis TaxID=1344951 RepID=A0A4V3QXG9_9SPHN|nr:glycoside hydrolase family 18 protein [Sphingomonas naasensis]
MTGYYVGYFWPDYPPEQVDMRAMTHFVFGRVAPGGGSLPGGVPGELVPGGGSSQDPHDPERPDPNKTVEDYLIGRAHTAGTKALLMLGGDGADGIGFYKSTADNIRPTFVKNIVDYLVAHDYDGVDVDWENYLADTQETRDAKIDPIEARRRLKQLIIDVRAAANARPRYQAPNTGVLITYPHYTVSINDLEPGGKVQQWQADIANLVDQFNLMSYGIGTAWNQAGWSSWFSSPIFGATGTTPRDLDSSITAYVKTGVPRERIGIGIGFYGIFYGPTITGPRQDTEHNNIFETNDVALRYSELVRLGYLSHGTYYWDEISQVGYRSYPGGGYVPALEPSLSRAGFLSYEDEASIAAKGKWVRETKLGGAIIWTVNYGYLPGSKTNPLLTAAKTSFLQR